MDGGASDEMKLQLEIERLRAANAVLEQALRDTRNELLEAREEICALNGDDEQAEPDDDAGLRSDVARGY